MVVKMWLSDSDSDSGSLFLVDDSKNSIFVNRRLN